MGIFRYLWVVVILVLGGAWGIVKGHLPYFTRYPVMHLRERVKRGIEAELWKRRPVGTVFFESDIRRILGFFKFLYLPVMDNLVKEGWCQRLEGLDSERGGRWQRRFFQS
jgi:hypothetical protein